MTNTDLNSIHNDSQWTIQEYCLMWCVASLNVWEKCIAVHINTDYHLSLYISFLNCLMMFFTYCWVINIIISFTNAAFRQLIVWANMKKVSQNKKKIIQQKVYNLQCLRVLYMCTLFNYMQALWTWDDLWYLTLYAHCDIYTHKIY